MSVLRNVSIGTERTEDRFPNSLLMAKTPAPGLGVRVVVTRSFWLRWPRGDAKSSAGKTTRLGRFSLQVCRTCHSGDAAGEQLDRVPLAATAADECPSPIPSPPLQSCAVGVDGGAAAAAFEQGETFLSARLPQVVQTRRAYMYSLV